MVRKFWGSTRWRCDRWIWGSVLLLIAAGQLFTAPHRLGMLLLLVAGLCFVSAWRRSTMPLYIVTDDELLIGTGLRGTKRLRWRDMQAMQQDGYGVRLIGREWFGGAPLSLAGLAKAERDEFIDLVRAKVDAANATDETNG